MIDEFELMRTKECSEFLADLQADKTLQQVVGLKSLPEILSMNKSELDEYHRQTGQRMMSLVRERVKDSVSSA